MPEFRIGISGWTYAPWRKVFFPEGLPQKQELAYAASQVNSIEINGTFYSLQRPSSYLAWYEQTPPDFVFSVKAPRFITHIKRLADVEAPLANFFSSGVLRLKEKLGPILWQLPPSFAFDSDRLRAFFSLLPRDTLQTARVARHHDSHVESVWTRTDQTRPLRHALEVRHASFKTPSFIELLREHHIALVVADTAGKWPFMEDLTADFVYVRLHGDEELYVSGYTPKSLDRWAEKIRAWSKGADPKGAALIASPEKKAHSKIDAYVYFDNDVKTHAPYDAMSLAHRLGLRPAPPKSPDPISVKEKPRSFWPAWRSKNAKNRQSSIRKRIQAAATASQKRK
ncbi:MAG TPA: DUF72 domain-containing protein [Opitutaceae bacterium]|nr:DUF72 domain-containing protein [Opitutaceae bacterium]